MLTQREAQLDEAKESLRQARLDQAKAEELNRLFEGQISSLNDLVVSEREVMLC